MSATEHRSNEHMYYLEERHQEILSLLDGQTVVHIPDLCAHFGVSATTIRKDLRTLEKQGLVRRTHGGAIKPNPNTVEMHVDVAAVSAHAEKVSIGRAAASFVSDGDVLFVQSGTTCREFVRALSGRRGITLITNDLAIAMQAETVLPDGSIMLIGGTLRTGFHYTQGIEAVRNLDNFNIPLAFMCCNAFSFSHGFSAHRVEQANWMRAILHTTEQHIMLLDSTKVGVNALACAAKLTDFRCLVTDEGVDADTRCRFAEEAPCLEVVYA